MTEQIDAPGTDSNTPPLEEVSALEFAHWQTGGVAGDLVPGAVEAWAQAIERRDRHQRAQRDQFGVLRGAARAARATSTWYEADQDRGGTAAMTAYYDGYLAALKRKWWQRA